MSQANVEAVRQGYEKWTQEGFEVALAEFIDPDVELHDIVEMPDGSVHRGHEGARRMWAQWTELWEEFRFSLEEAADLGDDAVLARVRAVGRVSGSAVPVEVRLYEVWTLRDGKGIRRIASTDRASALKAAGISE